MLEWAPVAALGVAICGLAGLFLRGIAGGRRGLRRGPWPGLTPRGAAVLAAFGLLEAGVLLLLGPADLRTGARAPLPWLPLAVGLGLVPLLLGVRRLRTPGAISAIAGAYLLPRALISLLWPWLAPPLALWPGVLLLELGLWSRVLPRPWRRALAGGAAGLAVALIEGTYELALSAPSDGWAGPELLLGVTFSTLLGAFVTHLFQPPVAPRVPRRRRGDKGQPGSAQR